MKVEKVYDSERDEAMADLVCTVQINVDSQNTNWESIRSDFEEELSKLIAIERMNAAEEFKKEVVNSVKLPFKPHIEGVWAVYKRKVENES